MAGLQRDEGRSRHRKLKLGDVIIGALAVVNAAGDVLDWRTGRIIAGALGQDRRVADSVELMRHVACRTIRAGGLERSGAAQHDAGGGRNQRGADRRRR